jgi:formylglycine-generating enzyme required for sulfatase activity
MTPSPTTKYRINLHSENCQSRYYVEALGDDIDLKMVEIPGGSFLMGSPEDEGERLTSESPQHQVTLKGFFMGMYPITQAQWRAIACLPAINQKLDAQPSRFKGDRNPVERVSWHDAVEFCARLSKHTTREYDLPTEAEWEYACRASPLSRAGTLKAGNELGGVSTPFHFGETITTDLANYDGTNEKYGAYGRGPKGVRRGQTIAVGSFPPNAFGLHDMHGNVWEWCADHWHENYASKPDNLKQDGNTPWLLDGDREASRSLRGGSWLNGPRDCRSAYRNSYRPDERVNDIGFRVVCRVARTR